MNPPSNASKRSKLRLLSSLSRDDAHEFKPLLSEIEDDPGSPLGPLVIWLVMLVFGVFIVWTILGQVDVVVTARGKVIPRGEIKTLQPLNGGLVREILVKEGDFVHKGQALVVIDPSTTQPSLEANQKTLAHVQLEQARLEASASHTHFQADQDDATQSRLYQASALALEKQLSAKEKQLANLSAQVAAKRVEVKQTQEVLSVQQDKLNRVLAVRDIVPKDEYEKAKADVLLSESKLKTLAYELEQLSEQKQQTLDEKAYLEQNFNSTILTDLSEKEKQVNQLQANIQEASFRNARQTLISPVDGYVHELLVHTVGGVITPAQKVVSIVPVNTPLLIRTTVQNRDIGFIKEGMPVALKIDTYDFQKYGTLKGIVAHVDKDSKEDPKQGPVYTVDITPQQHALKVDGQWQRLSTGLSLTAEIKTGKRHIIEFFIYPLIKHLDEGMSVR